MNVWWLAILISIAIGFVIASIQVALLGPVRQEFSGRALGLGSDPRISEVVGAMSDRAKRGASLSAFKSNLAEPTFWQAFFVFWFGISAMCFVACAVLLWVKGAI